MEKSLEQLSLADSNTLRLFSYSPLPGRRFIRLIRLAVPSHGSGIVSCKLSSHPILGGPRYTALSYTWGPPKRRHDQSESNPVDDQSSNILVNGSSFLVTPNLRGALARLQALEPDVLLWVDAICINQDDLAERSSQVNLMAEIYGNSAGVTVWLGEEDANTAETMELVHEILNAASATDEEGFYINLRTVGHWAYKNPEALASIGLPAVTEDQWRSLIDLYSRRWFNRLWVVQETALPRDERVHRKGNVIRLVCGSVQMRWEDLFRCAQYLQSTGIANGLLQLNKLPANLETEFLFTQSLKELTIIRSLCHGELLGRQVMSEQVREYDAAAWSRAFSLTKGVYDPNAYFCLFQYLLRDWQSTDPRDKIFALIGLIDHIAALRGPSDKSFLTADYSKPVEQVYLEVTTSVLRNTDRLSLLLLTADPILRRYSNLPSWVIDYSVKGPIPLLLWGDETDRVSHFDVAKGYSKAYLSFSDDGLRLKLNGHKLGSVTDTGETMDELGAKHTFERSAALVLKCGETYFNGQSRLEALWRSLITDQTPNTNPAPEEAGTFFFGYLKALFRHNLFRQILDSSINAKPGEQICTSFRGSPSVDKLAKSDPLGQMPTMYGDLQSCTERMKSGSDLAEIMELEDAAYEEKIEAFYPYMNITLRMRLFRTDDGLLGMGPRSTQAGDEAWILQGARVPFVLRPCGESGQYRLIGQSYVHGMMQGEAIEAAQLQRTKLKEAGSIWKDVELV
ncbi:MAG: hypothetical protein Q9220_006197 [cf. Caloplaca sp. 1 TL-2023]